MGIENYEFIKLAEVPEVTKASKDAKVLMVDTVTDSEGNVSSPQVMKGPSPGGGVTWYSMAILGDYTQLSDSVETYVPCDENTSEDAINNIITESSGYNAPVYLFKGRDIPSIVEKGENTPYTSEDGDIPTLTEYITSLEEGSVNIKVLNPTWIQSMFDSSEADTLDNKSGMILSASSSYTRMKSKVPVEGRMVDVVYNMTIFAEGSYVLVFGENFDYKTGEEA